MELTDKVLIDNLCDWPLYFKRLNGMGDIRVPAKVKGYAMLDFAEVQMQVQSGNKLFVGFDASRPGDHARLYISNDEQRKALFGYEDAADGDVVALNGKSVAQLLAIRTKKEFNDRLQALVRTDAEKKMVVQLAKEAGGEEVVAWKMDAINQLAESVSV